VPQNIGRTLPQWCQNSPRRPPHQLPQCKRVRKYTQKHPSSSVILSEPSQPLTVFRKGRSTAIYSSQRVRTWKVWDTVSCAAAADQEQSIRLIPQLNPAELSTSNLRWTASSGSTCSSVLGEVVGQTDLLLKWRQEGVSSATVRRTACHRVGSKHCVFIR